MTASRCTIPVTGDGALVGEVTEVSSTLSVVTLITDHTLSVTARVLDTNDDTGELVPAVGNPDELVLQYLRRRTRHRSRTALSRGSRLSPRDSSRDRSSRTSRPTSRSGTSCPSTRISCSTTGTIQVSPQADLRGVDIVQILTRPTPGTERAQVP